MHAPDSQAGTGEELAAASEGAVLHPLDGLNRNPTPLPPSIRPSSQSGTTKKWPPAKRTKAWAGVTAAPRQRLSSVMRAWDNHAEDPPDDSIAASVRAVTEPSGEPEG